MADGIAAKQLRPRGKHGGARRGAGRPPKLTDEQRLWIGADCEGAFRAATQVRMKRATEDLFEFRSEFKEVIRQVNQTPLAGRRAFLRGDDFKWHESEVRMELAQILENLPVGWDIGESDDPNDPMGRWLRLRSIKPQGVRDGIIAAVAADWSKRVGFKIPESTVSKCWDWVRSIRKSLIKDDVIS